MDLTIIHNGQAVTTSLQVAETFGKKHNHVLEAIEQLIEGVAENPTYSKSPMFYKDTYEHPQNKQEYPMYYMNRDGFTLLAMGFTGKKAMDFKLKYIEAFNKMEATLKNQLPQNNLELALRAALEHEVAIKEIKEDVEELKDNLVVTSSQAKAINKKVSERVYAALGGENAPAFKELKNKVFKACWRDFKDLFDISEYRELPRIKFDLGMQFLCDWEPNATLKFEIKQLNNQGTLF